MHFAKLVMCIRCTVLVKTSIGALENADQYNNGFCYPWDIDVVCGTGCASDNANALRAGLWDFVLGWYEACRKTPSARAFAYEELD